MSAAIVFHQNGTPVDGDLPTGQIHWNNETEYRKWLRDNDPTPVPEPDNEPTTVRDLGRAGTQPVIVPDVQAQVIRDRWFVLLGLDTVVTLAIRLGEDPDLVRGFLDGGDITTEVALTLDSLALQLPVNPAWLRGDSDDFRPEAAPVRTESDVVRLRLRAIRAGLDHSQIACMCSLTPDLWHEIETGWNSENPEHWRSLATIEARLDGYSLAWILGMEL